jgi:DNA-binding HxlR family transcriptional regulator
VAANHEPSVSRTGRALALLGDHWTLLILQRQFLGERRYQQLRDALGVSDSTLSARLRTMTEGGLVAKVAYGQQPIRYEYRLTPAGQATWRIFVAAWMWRSQWLPRPPGPTPELIHLTCSQVAAPVLVCGHCGLEVGSHDTSVRRRASTLHYAGSLPRRHQQVRTLRRHDDYTLDPETIELLGDRWNTALMAAAVIGLRRFRDFEQFLAIPPAVLSARLTRLIELGELRTEPVAGTSRTDYRLTDKGRAFSGVLLQIVRWADENIRTGEPASIEIGHETCGRKLVPEFDCGHCRQRLQRTRLTWVTS